MPFIKLQIKNRFKSSNFLKLFEDIDCAFLKLLVPRTPKSELQSALYKFYKKGRQQIKTGTGLKLSSYKSYQKPWLKNTEKHEINQGYRLHPTENFGIKNKKFGLMGCPVQKSQDRQVKRPKIPFSCVFQQNKRNKHCKGHEINCINLHKNNIH